jgi:hypothetical protein
LLFGRRRVKELEDEVAHLRASVKLLTTQLQAMIEEKMELQRFISNIMFRLENVARHFQLPFEKDAVRFIDEWARYTDEWRNRCWEYEEILKKHGLGLLVTAQSAPTTAEQQAPAFGATAGPATPTPMTQMSASGLETAGLAGVASSTGQGPLVRDPREALKRFAALNAETNGLAKEVFTGLLLGYTIPGIASTLRRRERVVREVVESLVGEGLVRFMIVKHGSATRKVYFPSPFGREVCKREELIEGYGTMDWTHLQQRYFEDSYYKKNRTRPPSHERMVGSLREKLAHMSCRVEEEVEGADLVVDGLERERLYVEVETLGGTIDDMQRKVEKYAVKKVEPVFVVLNKRAQEMIEQRIAYCLFETRLEPKPEHFSYYMSHPDTFPSRAHYVLVRATPKAKATEAE